MRDIVAFLGSIGMILLISWKLSSSVPSTHGRTEAPVLVELFTSEGCSSCPPADALLQQMDQSGSAIVLSEHVDYWNQLGWKDPYSAHQFSQRQSAYAGHFGLNSVYTPQMVVDGNQEFVGSDASQADQALQKARIPDKISVRIGPAKIDAGELSARVEADALAGKSGEMFLAVALDQAESQVERGENAGRKLTHAGVVRSLTRIGVLGDKPFVRDVRLPLPTGDDPAHLRIIAFVQEAGPGRVLGARMRRLQD